MRFNGTMKMAPPAPSRRSRWILPHQDIKATAFMSLPVRHLPVIQNWDCHVCGNCCKEYPVSITAEEKARIEGQKWDLDAELKSTPLFKAHGPFWRRSYQLNRYPDGSCVFLSKEGRCRIHEKFGAEAKPLPCRLYPFILLPAGDHWRVGLRFACPSAAASKGNRLSSHDIFLKQAAILLETRENIADRIRLKNIPPPKLQAGQNLDWPDAFRFVRAIESILQKSSDRMERRIRKCLRFAALCREAKFDQVKGKKLDEFLEILLGTLDADVKAASSFSGPSWIGRILFRQVTALYARKDSGPNRGPASRSRISLLAAAARFSFGRGQVPRLHKLMSETTFADVELASSSLTPEMEVMLERYYLTKVGSLQFFGPGSFGMGFWEGLETLCLTFPAITWLMRTMPGVPRQQALEQAVSMVDDHFGFNLVLGSFRQRLSTCILVRSGELEKLVVQNST